MFWKRRYKPWDRKVRSLYRWMQENLPEFTEDITRVFKDHDESIRQSPGSKVWSIARRKLLAGECSRIFDMKMEGKMVSRLQGRE